MSYHVSISMERMSIVVNVLMEIIENDGEETPARLLAIQLMMILTGHDLAEVSIP